SRPLARGERVVYAEVEVVPAEEQNRILYEDSAFIFYDKPAGIASEDIRLSQVELVHRLDKETSGVLLFAKSHALFEAMVQLFKDKKVAKEYLALVDGVPIKKQ